MVKENRVCGCGSEGGALIFDVRFRVKPRNLVLMECGVGGELLTKER